MSVDEALVEARRLYGEAAHVRTLLGREIDGGRIGKVVGTDNVRVWGFGETWEEALAECAKRSEAV